MTLVRSAVAEQYDGPSGIRLLTAEELNFDPGHAVIDVSAAGVGYPDLLASYGKHQKTPPAPFVPGLEVAGVVRRAPAGSHVEVGSRVMAFVSGFGGFSDVVAVDPSNILPAPAHLDAAQASTFILNYHTAFYALTRRTVLRAGETILVTGAAGGLGTAAVQIARAIGAHVIATARTAAKRRHALDMGAHLALGPEDGLHEQVKAHTDGRGVDVVFDPVGGDIFTDLNRALAPNGRLLVLGFAGGSIPTIAANRLLLKNTSVLGVAWGPPVLTGDAHTDFVRQLTALTDSSPLIRPAVASIVDLDEAADALSTVEQGTSIGRIVLRCTDAGGWFDGPVRAPVFD